jgi:hypothetical protein
VVFLTLHELKGGFDFAAVFSGYWRVVLLPPSAAESLRIETELSRI